jgi:SNF2 family DNA or RNA helicase
LIHPKSAGHGLNLQHGGNRIIWYRCLGRWSCLSRRSGACTAAASAMTCGVTVLISRNTVDERVWAALHDKRSMSDIALEELKDADKCATEELAG